MASKKVSNNKLIKNVESEKPKPKILLDRPDYGRYRMPFGRHRGKALDAIPLTYLDYLVGMPDLREDVKQVITTYLEDPLIQDQLRLELDKDST